MDRKHPPDPRSRAEQRVAVLAHLARGAVNEDQAAAILQLSARQLRRLAAAYRSGGPAALRHGNAGRDPANRTAAELRERVVALAETTYAGLN